MPRQENILTVFVASPDDVGDERTRLEEVIEEFNLTWSRVFGVRLDLIRWETHSYPGVGSDAQDVINKQIPEDYDIFIGIMWCRYGTPTGRAGSGTIEEFERAKTRYDANPESLKIMIYFKDELISPSCIDSDQFKKVNDFKKSLGDEGVLYWNFTGQEQFAKLVRLHLTRQVQSWKSQIEQVSTIKVAGKQTKQEAKPPCQETSEDDLGLFEVMDTLNDQFSKLNTISEHIIDAIGDVGDKMNQRTNEMNLLPRDSQGNANTVAVKRLISFTASDMDEFTARMETELPIFSNALNEGMNALIRVCSLSVDLDTEENAAERRNERLEEITSLLEVFTNSKGPMLEFRETVARLPRLTSDLNRAKRRVVSVIDRLIDEFSNGQSLLRESEAIVQGGMTMAEKYAPFPIEYNAEHESWKVKMKDSEVDCDSKSDAEAISDIPCLYKELESGLIPSDDGLIQRLQRTVEMIERYRISFWASRKIERVHKEILQKRES